MTIDHNLFYDPTGAYNSSTFGTNYIKGNPLLTNPITDFSLQAGSPAIGTGSPTGAPTTDYAGNARSATAPCIGAYEYVATGGFVHGTSHTASFEITVQPANESCQVQLWLAVSATASFSSETAKSSLISFISGTNVPVSVPITMPAAGIYYVYIDLYMLGIKIESFTEANPITVI